MRRIVSVDPFGECRFEVIIDNALLTVLSDVILKKVLEVIVTLEKRLDIGKELEALLIRHRREGVIRTNVWA